MGIPTVAQQDQPCLCITSTQVQSPAQHSGLKDPALSQFAAPYAMGQPKKKKKQKKKRYAPQKLKLPSYAVQQKLAQHCKSTIL